MQQSVSGRAEDYLRTAYEIIEEKGYARIKDVARELNVKPSTVVEMMKNSAVPDLFSMKNMVVLLLPRMGRKLQKP